MSDEQLEKVISHIEDAQSWLARARSYFCSANPARGELDLSLAQAEAKFAWELSRGGKHAEAQNRRRRLSSWWLPAAACLGLGILAAFLLPRLVPTNRPGAVAHAPAAVSPGTTNASGMDRHEADLNVPAAASQNAAAPPAPGPTAGRRQTVAVNDTAAPEANLPETAPAPQPAAADNGLTVDLHELERIGQEALLQDPEDTEAPR